jgi:hypothetical protein
MIIILLRKKTNMKIFISYTETILNRQERRQFLFNNYYFKCKCLRCIEKDGIVYLF